MTAMRVIHTGPERAADSANSSQLWPEVLFEQAADIIMKSFDLDRAHALQVLRKMSQNMRTQVCVVAEQIINHNVPLEALRGIEDVMYPAPADPREESA
jgi:hypothetical protein